MDINALLTTASLLGASDLHITVGLPPMIRLNGVLQPINEKNCLPAETIQAIAQILTAEQQQVFNETGELDFSFSITDVGHFRVNVFHQRGMMGMVVRMVKGEVPSCTELRMPPVLQELAMKPKGLLLVTGPTGSGKSTTLAALVDYINNNKRGHIITIEDPLEYLHEHKKCIVNQREVGTDTQSFAAALRAALRQDPDVILVGELRDLETISIAITAAETGHLVMTTLHTSSADQTIDRIIDVFPAHQQQQIRTQLAATLLGISAQQLIPRTDDKGMIAAFEVLIANAAVKNLIRESKTHQIISIMQTGSKLGMQTMDAALSGLYQQGIISHEEFAARINNQETVNLFPPKH